MSRYREKTEDELDWNEIRRNLTRALDTHIMNRRERMLNTLLSEAFARYTAALADGDTVQLEDDLTELVKRIVIPVVPEAEKVFD